MLPKVSATSIKRCGSIWTLFRPRQQKPENNFAAVLKRRKPKWDSMLGVRLKTDDDTYVLGEFLGKGSSRVYLTKDKKHVVKMYLSKSLLPVYEFWVSKYYRENQLMVPEVVAGPGEMVTELGKMRVIVKEYYEGLKNSEVSDPLLLELGLSREQYEAMATDIENRVDELHANGRFRDWLEENGQIESPSSWVNKIVFQTKVNVIQKGDTKPGNRVLTESGQLRIIDP